MKPLASLAPLDRGMGYSTKNLPDFAEYGGIRRGVQFDLIIALDFYDGPERGYAFWESGEGLRFTAIGECKYPILRAFHMVLLDGNWPDMVKRVANKTRGKPGGKMVFTSESDADISLLLRTASQAEDRSNYVAAGHAYLDKVAVSAISIGEAHRIQSAAGKNNLYDYVHGYIKDKEEVGFKGSGFKGSESLPSLA